jgi:hypothetical protein
VRAKNDVGAQRAEGGPVREAPTPSIVSRVRGCAPAAALAAVALIAYAPAFTNGFVWDDHGIVETNPDTRDLGALPRVLLSPDEFPPYYRPLNRASYLVDYQLFGMDPRGFHAVNVALHVATVLALYALGRRLFRSRGPAVVGALLLAIHPVHAEAVNFVAARNNILAALFTVVSFVLLIDAHERESRARSLASGAALFLGLLSKEPAVMVLPVMAAWLLFPRAFGRERRERLAWLVPHVVACGLYLVMRYVSLGGLAGASPPAAATASLGARLATNLYTVPRYLSLLVVPRDLSIFHAIPAALPVASLVAAWVLLLAALAYFVARPAPASTVGWLWFWLKLLPIANLVAIPTTSLVAERYFYLPGIGLWLVVADACRRAAGRVAWRPIAAIGGIAAAALVAATFVRSLDWHDDRALATSAIRAEPAAAEAHFNLGVVLKDAGDLAGARREWEVTLRLDPNHARALVQRGTASAVGGDLRSAEDDLTRAIAMEHDIALAHFNLARVYELTGRPARAADEYREFLELSRAPSDAPFVARAEERLATLRGPPR